MSQLMTFSCSQRRQCGSGTTVSYEVCMVRSSNKQNKDGRRVIQIFCGLALII